MNVWQIISIAIALIGLLTGGVGQLASKKKDVIIDTLTKDNVATKDYNKTLEATLATRTAERDAATTRADELKELAQGSPQLKILTSEFSKFAKAMTQQNGLLKEFIKHYKVAK